MPRFATPLRGSPRWLNAPTIISLVALFSSLGGTAVALKKGSVTSRDIRNNTIRSVDVRDGGIRGVDIKRSAIDSDHVENHSLSADDVEPSAFEQPGDRLGTSIVPRLDQNFRVPPGQTAQTKVSCGPGETNISGGYGDPLSGSESSGIDPGNTVVANVPLGNGWLVSVHNSGSEPDAVTVVAYCANIT